MKINIGGGFEKIDGWLNADESRDNQCCFGDKKFDPDVIIDVDELPLPFEDGSIDAFRMRDVMIETNHICNIDPGSKSYEHWKKFAKEIERCLKPGGMFILIEHQGYHVPYDEVLELVLREKGPAPDYMDEEPEKYYFIISIYQKKV